uniref:Uncharacterized protein n=1 Tax=Branchiostoma floridae TaxID=7739 RepID=C3XUA4_BRAFL|eukprot:XP_002612469.1 hypothetical protein BRAFLDRAFT_75415 [Branchiostoma floridae]
METIVRDLGHGDGGKERSPVRLERPDVCCLVPEPALCVEVDHTGSNATDSQHDEPTVRSDDRRVSVATLREAAEIVAHQGEGDVKGTAGHSHGRVVRRAARLYRRAKRAASETTTTGASKVRRKRQKRKVEEEVEDDSRPQPKRKAPESPTPRTYYDPRLSRVAPIYQDVVAGERVLVNFIADDPCPWESTNSVELSACERGVTPTDFDFCSCYRQYQDFHTRKVLSLVASELTMWLDNQESDRM